MINDNNNLAVYIHIPFCMKKCAYCDFLSARPKLGQLNDYKRAILEEISLKSDYAKKYTIKTIFIGGGTPSLPDAEYIRDILTRLRLSFEAVRKGSFAPDEVTIECNPGTVTQDKLRIYRISGINRLSFGLQSADDNELKLLGRIHNFKDWCISMEMARQAGFDNINVDLISGIPGQMSDSFSNTLNKVLRYKPEHISVYSLIIEEGTPFYDKYRPELLSESEIDSWEDEDRKIYEQTRTLLLQDDYARYEISNYAKPGFECKHNLVYWERGNYIGIGLGAASMIDNVRFSNTRNHSEYNDSRHRLDESSVEKLSIEDQMSEYVVLGLRKTAGISCEKFKDLFGKDINDVFGNPIKKWESTGMLVIESGRMHCTEDGLNICNRIMVDFLF